MLPDSIGRRSEENRGESEHACFQKDLVITTNLTFAEWSSVFNDAEMTTALLDGLRHHCAIIETGNESNRFRQSSEEAKVSIKGREKIKRNGKTPEDILYVENPF